MFTSGSINLTGIKDTREAIAVTNLVCEQLFTKGVTPTKGEAVEMHVRMINTTFSIPFNVNLLDLYNNQLKTFPNLMSKYTPTGRPGVQLRIPVNQTVTNDKKTVEKTVSVFTFASGKIVVTGSKDPDQLLEAYTKMVNYLDSNHAHFCSEAPPPVEKVKGKRGRKRKADSAAMYSDLFN